MVELWSREEKSWMTANSINADHLISKFYSENPIKLGPVGPVAY